MFEFGRQCFEKVFYLFRSWNTNGIGQRNDFHPKVFEYPQTFQPVLRCKDHYTGCQSPCWCTPPAATRWFTNILNVGKRVFNASVIDLFVLRCWKVSEIDNGKPRWIFVEIALASSLRINVGYDCQQLRFRCRNIQSARTSLSIAHLRNCFRGNKLPKSMVSKPTFSNWIDVPNLIIGNNKFIYAL